MRNDLVLNASGICCKVKCCICREEIGVARRDGTDQGTVGGSTEAVLEHWKTV